MNKNIYFDYEIFYRVRDIKVSNAITLSNNQKIKIVMCFFLFLILHSSL